MSDHNPYVGIQHTVFEQGWKRALKEARKRIADEFKAAGVGASAPLRRVERAIDEMLDA